MLDELQIRGLGVIDEAVLPLGPGLTVVTGETGAGKTMVVTGLLLLFGGRADSARVRTGREQATVDGRLTVAGHAEVISRVTDAGGSLDDDNELVVRRVVSASGRSRAFVGGAPTPVSVLAELADGLVAVHGQSDQIRLSRPAEQRSALDRYAGIDLSAFAEAYAAWSIASAALADRITHAAQLRRETDVLKSGIAEIEAAEPQPGEDLELSALSKRLSHADALRLAASAAHDALRGNPDDLEALDATTLIGSALRALHQQAGDDEKLDALAERLAELATLAADLGSDLGAYADDLDADPARLERVQARRAVLTALVRKYADDPEPDIAAVLRWAAAAQARLDEIDVSDDAIDALRAKVRDAADLLTRLAVEISERRGKAAEQLAAAVSEEIAGLAMPDARVEIRVARRAPIASGPTLEINGELVGVTVDGIDDVDLRLQPHPSAPALPIGKGASGGELSRVMLAIEVCLADTSPVPTLVFDEVDAGVGGRAAVEVGRRLARLASQHQVVVVTHLAQVAAFADRHIVVDKPRGAKGSVTSSDVHPVDGDARVAELARMLAGSDTATARKHASELLASAAKARAN